MEDTSMIALWQSYTQKLNESLELNKKNAMAITQMKVGTLLAAMKPIKILAIVAGLLWVAFMDTIIISVFYVANPFFLVSAIAQVLLTKLAIGIYCYQFILIHQADISEPVLATQEKLARLRVSTLWVPRLLLLQLPCWTTFYWNTAMFNNGNIVLYVLQAVVTLSFTVLAVWLFVHIKYENRHKKWFRLLFNGGEWTPLMKSAALLEELTNYKKQDNEVN